jgi:hypothetical protein
MYMTIPAIERSNCWARDSFIGLEFGDRYFQLWPRNAYPKKYAFLVSQNSPTPR